MALYVYDIDKKIVLLNEFRKRKFEKHMVGIVLLPKVHSG